MATLTNEVLGKISGSIGDITFRRRNGKTFIVNKSTSYKTPCDATSVKRRKNFGFACTFAAAVNRVDPLHFFWRAAAPKHLSAYLAIVQSVAKKVTDCSFTADTPIVPGSGFDVRITSLSFSSTQLQITAGPLDISSGIEPSLETGQQLVAILSFSNPNDPLADLFQLSSLVSLIQSLSLNTELRFSIPLNNIQSQQFARYKMHKVACALITLDANSNPVHHSNTIVV